MNQDRLNQAKKRLLAEIVQEALETALWTGRKVFSAPVMAAMEAVPRHEFVAPEDTLQAYANRPLPIGRGQTISQPYIVAVMTDFLDLEPASRVLEIGAGCGYQTAVLAELAAKVFSVEVIAELAEGATKRLGRLGYENITLKTGDGLEGWPEKCPYDAIIVTAAADAVPKVLFEQMKPAARIVIPIGSPYGRQILYRGVMGDDGVVKMEKTLPVAFVPLVGKKDFRWPRD
ncbi:MAG TPA: protein-L-isoaspartate(D-aspartate) O-methyltransferase [Alphaproteobacteria bacterium]|nr:protein-L-isoaspartate(D-aspartate) O-methyltransferase [Alphaproteobacteria bacterium]